MDILRLKNISKLYQTGDEKKYALRETSISFPNAGLVCILGKSGCGKSTLLNIMSLIDKPSSGEVYFYGENTKKWNQRKINDFHTKQIGIIFQHYCLLEDETVLFNVMLPMLISGKKECDCKEDAITLLKSIKIPDVLYEEKARNLSGGEKERIAILRAIINNPKIIFADEPTGALDIENAKLVMEMLKKISKKKLVIMVSHNKKLVKEYADRIIEISDGKIIDDRQINDCPNIIPLVKENKRSSNKKWVTRLIKSNYKKRFGFHCFSIISSVFALCSAMLIFGFSYNSKNSVHNQMKNHFDYEMLTVTKEIQTSEISNGFSIVKTVRPTLDELYSNQIGIPQKFYIGPNYDALIKPVGSIFVNDKNLDSITISCVYSFEQKDQWQEMIIDGDIPEDGFNCVVINEKCRNYLDQNGYKNIDSINIKSEFDYYVNDRLIDKFVFNQEYQIKCVVKELNFLNTEKIYYSYNDLDEYMKNCYSNGESWKSIVENADSDSEISSYSYKLFLKDQEFDISTLQTDKTISLTSNSLVINNALEEFCDIGTKGIIVYLVIAILGVVLIVGITTFFNYSRDKKKIALLSCLGASFNDVCEMYSSEAIIDGIIGLIFGIVSTIFLERLINYIIESTTGLKSILLIPWFKFMNINYGFPLIITLAFIVIILLSSLLPILLTKRVSIKEELKEE